jgi:hypothetical protein
MVSYRLSPCVHFIESHLIPNASQYAVFHQFTGEVFEPGGRVRALLFAAKLGNKVSFSNEDLDNLGDDGKQIRKLIDEEFLVADGYDPLSSFLGHYAVRPLQNPAVAYRSETGAMRLVRISMAERVYSPRPDELPEIIEEDMPPLAADIFVTADGTRTLQEILAPAGHGENTFEEPAAGAAIQFLTSPQRQLIKLTRTTEELDNPFKPFNTVPRNFFHSSRWGAEPHERGSKSIIDFHREGIQDASWEFDVIEPTVNHALRFPSEALGGLDYGSRFCLSTLKAEVLPLVGRRDQLEILEVGGGTGTFARSFIEQARRLSVTSPNCVRPNYHIMDLSLALIESQQRVLSDVQPAVKHFEQDATEFDLPGCVFDLIIANEVVADFPMAVVRRNRPDQTGEKELRRAENGGPNWVGDGVPYLQKYGLSVEDAPDHFFVNAGVFRFIERAWQHLAPGGALILSEYGDASRYPVESFHLNHAEFSIHFGHVMECAQKLGFQCRLLKLKEFLEMDDQAPMLNGREEHIRCLNHVLEKYGMSLPFALVSAHDFRTRFQELVSRIELSGFSFQPLRNNFHYGPNVDNFMVLIMKKPLE